MLIFEHYINKYTRRTQEREVLTYLAIFSRIFEIGRPVYYLVCEIGYYRGGCITCLNHKPTPHKAVFGPTTRRIRLR